MIKIHLRSAYLAAAVAVLSMTASAQTDASFAAAQGPLPSGLAVMAELKAQPKKPPIDERPGVRVNQKKLSDLHGAAMVLGEVIAPTTSSPYTGWMITQPDSGEEFEALSATFFGPAPDNIRQIQFLATRRAAAAAGSRVDYYMFTTDGEGILMLGTRFAKVIGLDGKEIKLPSEKLDHRDPADQAVFIRILAQWNL